MFEVRAPKATWVNLFGRHLPSEPYLHAVLSGTSPGTVLVDDPERISMCVVRTLVGPTYVSKDTSDAFLEEAIARLRRLGLVGLMGRRAPDALTDQVAETIDRFGFDECDLTSEWLRDLRDTLPSGVEARLLDRDVMTGTRCGREMPEHFGGDIDRYLATGYGVFLVRDGEVVCESYTSHVGLGHAEINVATAEAHRRQGLASIACAFLAEEARKRGHRIYWACNASNAGSIAVARRLGFRRQHRHLIDILPVSDA